MATVYCRASDAEEIMQLLGHAITEWHKPIKAADVRIGVLWATSKDKDVRPLMKDGFPLLAQIRRLSIDWRVLTNLDAVVKIDEAAYADLPDVSRLALIDHELAHLVVVCKPGADKCERDEIGRPKLRVRKGDWRGSDGFRAVVKRHGPAAVEFITAKSIYTFAKDSLDTSPVGAAA